MKQSLLGETKRGDFIDINADDYGHGKLIKNEGEWIQCRETDSGFLFVCFVFFCM